MLDITEEIESKGSTIEVSPQTGELNGGELRVDSVMLLSGEDSAQLEFTGYHNWSDIESVISVYAAKKLIEIEKSNIDTSDSDYTEPKVLEEGTDKAKLMKALYHLAPCTNSQLHQEGRFSNVSGKTYSLKDDGLVACVGWEDGNQVLVPTALGVKEIYAIWSIPPTGNATQDYLSSENKTEEEDE